MTGAIVDLLSRLDPRSRVQIVGSVKAGPGGVDEINAVLQGLHSVGKAALNGGFFPGDPVMVTRNDHGLGVMNGDVGVAVRDDGDGLLCRFATSLKVLTSSTVQEAELGYAVTCHKAQGSQYPIVVIPVVPSRLLDRILLLTAISRAERLVVLVGDRDAFASAVRAPAAPDRRQVGFGRVASGGSAAHPA